MRILGWALAGLLLVPAGPHRWTAADEEGAPSAAASADLRRAADLAARAEALEEEGDLGRAAETLERALRLQERARGADHPDLAPTLGRLGHLRWRLRDHEAARGHFDRLIRLLERTVGPEDPSLATPAYNLALQLDALGRREEARASAERALRVVKAAYGPSDPRTATRAIDLAQLLIMQGEFDSARLHYDEAASTLAQSLGPAHPERSRLLLDTAFVLRQAGRDQEAIRLLEATAAAHEAPEGDLLLRAERLTEIADELMELPAEPSALRLLLLAQAAWRDLGRPDGVEVARLRTSVAMIRRERGELADARSEAERAVAYLETAGADHAGDLGTALNALGLVLEGMGDLVGARGALERAVRLREATDGPGRLALAQSLTNLAGTLRLLGDLEGSRTAFEQSLALQEAALGPEDASLAPTWSNLALLLQDMGQEEPAAVLLRRALGALERGEGDASPWTLTAAGNLALVLSSLDEHEEAEGLLRRVVAGSERVHGAEHPATARASHNLGSFLLERGRPAEGRVLLERALATYERGLGADHPVTALSMRAAANARQEAGDGPAALDLLRRSARILEGALGPDHRYVGHALQTLATAEARMDLLPEARDHLLDALARLDRRLRRDLLLLTLPQRLALLADARQGLGAWLVLSGRMGVPAYEQVLRFKGLATRAEAAARAVRREGDPRVAARLAEMQGALQRLSSLASTVPPSGNVAARGTWRRAYASAASDAERLTRELQRESLPMRRALARLDLDLAAVRTAVPVGAALVDLLRSGERYAAWVTRAGGEPVRLDLGDASSIDRAAEAFVRSFTSSAAPDEETARAPGILRDRILSPVEQALGDGIAALWLSPDSALATVPFAALPGRSSGTILADDYQIAYVAMAQDLVPDPAWGPPGKGALLVGDVDYGAATERAPDEVLAASSTGFGHEAGHRAPRGRTFDPLPATRAEAEGIAAGSSEPAVLLLGDRGTEGRVRAHVVGKRVIHLATHGFVREDAPRAIRRLSETESWLGAGLEQQLAGWDPRLLSGLALAGANPRRGGGRDDGILTALEASWLDLQGCELVVLSACESALGRLEAGEGVVGLVQAFQAAGARDVVASLWRVEDRATGLLMARFHELLRSGEKPMRASQALQQAAQWLRGWRDGKGRQPYAAPRYWAPFVCYERR